MKNVPIEIETVIKELNDLAQKCNEDFTVLRNSMKSYQEQFNRLSVILEGLVSGNDDRIKPEDLPF